MNQTGNSNIGGSWTTVYTYTAAKAGVYSFALTADGGNGGGTSSILRAGIYLNGQELIGGMDISRPNYAGNNNSMISVSAAAKVGANTQVNFRILQDNRTSNVSWRCVIAQTI